jgi:RNA polymerase sigma factor (sigma-70 family)
MEEANPRSVQECRAMPRSVSSRAGLMAVVLGTALSAFPAAAEARTVGDLSRYCNACWRNARLDPGCWGDCTQEVFCRLLERVPTASWDAVLHAEGEERREFLRAIDAVKKRTQRQRRWAATTPETIADYRLPGERRRAEDRQTVERAAVELLSPRQQAILRLSFEGWSVQEMAEELRTSPERVSDEKYKAIRKLRAHLCRGDFERG